MLDLVIADFPVLDKIDPQVRVRGIKRYVIDKAKAMHKSRSAIVSLIRGHAPGMLRHPHLLEQKGMIAFFDPEDIVQSVMLQRLDVRSIGTEAVFSDDELQVGMILPQFGHKAFGSIGSQSFLLVPSCLTIGSGINGMTARISG